MFIQFNVVVVVSLFCTETINRYEKAFDFFLFHSDYLFFGYSFFRLLSWIAIARMESITPHVTSVLSARATIFAMQYE